jgi:hypothetical protein
MSQELGKRCRVVFCAWAYNGSSMRHEDFRGSRPFAVAATKIGAALRDRYDLTEPPPQSLVDLLNQLDARVARERTETKLYAAVGDAVAAVIDVTRNECASSERWNDNGARDPSEGVEFTERQAGPARPG